MGLPTIPDPFQLGRKGLDQLEARVNRLATRKMMESPDFALQLERLAKVSLGLHHVFAKMLAGVYERLDLPSRSELRELAAAVRRVEDRLDQLLPVRTPPSALPKPPRTRRPGTVQPAARTPAPTTAPAAPPKAPRAAVKRARTAAKQRSATSRAGA